MRRLIGWHKLDYVMLLPMQRVCYRTALQPNALYVRIGRALRSVERSILWS